MPTMSDLILFAAKHHSDSGGEALLGFVFILIVALVAIAASVQKSKHITQNWRGRPLTSREVVKLIGNTRTMTSGLRT